MFEILDNDRYEIVHAPKEDLRNRIDSGVYQFSVRPGGMMSSPRFILQKTLDYTKGVIFDTGVFKETRNFILNFFKPEMVEARNELGMKHKVGVMFAGEPGTGKTFTAGQMGQLVADKFDAISIMTTQADDYSHIISMIREKDPDRKVVIIIDEFEKTFERDNTKLLSWLDGNRSLDNVLVIATVNNINKLPTFLTDRPGRFENIFSFNFESREVLNALLEGIIPKKYKTLLDRNLLINTIQKLRTKSIDKIMHILRDAIAVYIGKKPLSSVYVERELIGNNYIREPQLVNDDNIVLTDVNFEDDHD